MVSGTLKEEKKKKGRRRRTKRKIKTGKKGRERGEIRDQEERLLATWCPVAR